MVGLTRPGRCCTEQPYQWDSVQHRPAANKAKGPTKMAEPLKRLTEVNAVIIPGGEQKSILSNKETIMPCPAAQLKNTPSHNPKIKGQ